MGDKVCMSQVIYHGSRGHVGRISGVLQGAGAFPTLRAMMAREQSDIYYIVQCECGGYGFIFYD